MTDQGIGVDLSRRFYERLVAPVLHGHFPRLRYAAARIGLGSEVLGYDTMMSTDHDYGPCVQIFLPPAAFDKVATELMRELDAALPETFEGWPVRYPTHFRPSSGASGEGMLGSSHGVELYTLTTWCKRFLSREFESAPSPLEWLCYPEHLFLMVTAGGLFRDDLSDLTALRERLSYFPRDVWLYKLAAQWGRIAEERAYVGRAGSVGDELGSRIVAARMVGNLMKLAMLIERQYAPYPKWFGTAFSRLPIAPLLTEALIGALEARQWEDREARLFDACKALAQVQVTRGVPGASAPVEDRLLDRPFRFIDTMSIADGLRAAISDDQLRQMPQFGGADQFIGANFVLAAPDWSRTMAEALFRFQVIED